MHLHRIATFLLGLWFAGLVLVSYVATHNFQRVDQILARPGAEYASKLAPLTHAEARMVLRHQAAELNRDYFGSFEQVELVVGLLLCAALFSLQNLRTPWRLLGLAILALTLFSHFALTPDITNIGRKLDFLDPAAQTPERTRFWQLHGVYSGVELSKMALILVLTGKLLIQRSRRSRLAESRKQADLVNDRYHSQVDR